MQSTHKATPPQTERPKGMDGRVTLLTNPGPTCKGWHNGRMLLGRNSRWKGKQLSGAAWKWPNPQLSHRALPRASIMLLKLPEHPSPDPAAPPCMVTVGQWLDWIIVVFFNLHDGMILYRQG